VLAERRLEQGHTAELGSLLDEVLHPPIEQIGALAVNDFLPPKDRKSFATATKVGQPTFKPPSPIWHGGWVMAFSRSAREESMPPSNELTARMVGIGMNFGDEARQDADIESTLVYASVLGMDGGDLRVLAVLTTWLGVHHSHINADRLVRFVKEERSERARAYWSAVASWLVKDRRFSRLVGGDDGPTVQLLPTGTEFQIKRRGEDERFVHSRVRVPKGALRDRSEDVLSPEALVRRHAGYRYRVLMGPSFRADVWLVLERAPDLSVAEVARRASCSFATAWQTARDFRLLRDSQVVSPFGGVPADSAPDRKAHAQGLANRS
jgi:hypothetical protein